MARGLGADAATERAALSAVGRLSDSAAADVLAPLCEEIGEPLENGLAARRYAISGDRRALHGTVL
ncbi:hypothetical protein [Streptomyces sp. NPDC056713]|uniref:hypothetical protein n=1 Tax=Streptomyces sp. NPDC056713 TaxID=3345921 RepID=UPI00368737F5